MEETREEMEARNFRYAVSKLASLVRRLAEERHDEKGHEGQFYKCDDPVCAEAVEVDRSL